MNLDIRLPIGLMFTLFGLIIALYGVIADSAQYERSGGLNVNLWWGLVLLGFGAAMLLLAGRAPRTPGPPSSPGGTGPAPPHP
jgi:hypothetical protein